MIALFYFMSTQHQIHVSYYMFLYYFCGNFMFGMMLFQPICLFVDKPIQAMLNLKRDIKDTKYSQYYKIDSYIKNFMNEEDSEEDEFAENDLPLSENDKQVDDRQTLGAILTNNRDNSMPVVATAGIPTKGDPLKDNLDVPSSDRDGTQGRGTAATSRQGTAARGTDGEQPRFTRLNDLDQIEELKETEH